MGITDHLICLLRNLYAGQEATVRTPYGTTDWFRIEKGVWWGCLLSPCLLTYTQNTSGEMPDWMSYKLEPRLPGEISTTSNMYMNHPKGRKRRETKEPLDKGEGGEWKSQLKTQYWKTKIMTPLPITSQQIEGENMEAVTDLPSQALKSLWMGTAAMTLENDCFLAGNLWQT